MLFAEYDYDTDIAVQRQEAAEEAVEKMNAKLTEIQEEAEREKKKAEATERARFLSVWKMRERGLEDTEISEISGFSIEEIRSILEDYQ